MQIRKDYRKGKTASALLAGGKFLGTSANYRMEEEVLPGGWTFFPPSIVSGLS